MRRLGALVCCSCRNVSRVLHEVADWSRQPIQMIRGLCTDCANAQLKKNQAHVRQTVSDKLATDRDTYRAQNAHSSSDYRRACEAMQPDVDAAMGGWAMGTRW